MKIHKLNRFVPALVLCAIATAPALGATYDTTNVPRPYAAAFTTAFSPSGVPYAGDMRLLVREGRITGTYTGTSVRPDFLNDRIEPVVGTVDPSDGHVQFDVGNALTFNGTMYSDGTISGTADYRGGFYDFMAKPR